MFRRASFKRLGIAARLGGWFLVLALLPFGLFGYMVYRDSVTTIKREATYGLLAVADGKASQIESYIRERQSDVATLARTPSVVSATEEFKVAFTNTGIDSPEYAAVEKEIGPFLKYWQESLGFRNLFLISSVGDIVWTIKREEDLGTNLTTGNHSESGLARVADAARTLLSAEISSFEYYSPSNEQAAFLAAPIMKDGYFVGVLAAQISNEKLYALMRDDTGLGETGETLLVIRSDGDVLFASPRRHDSHAPFRRRVTIGSGECLPAEKAAIGRRGSGVALDYRGNEVMAIWRYLPGMGMGMVVKADTDEIFAPVGKLRNRMLTAGIILMLAAVAIGILVSRSVAVPIVQLARATREFALGEFSVRVTVRSEDEIGQLADSFNMMAARLHQAVNARDEEIAERKRAEQQIQNYATTLESNNLALEELNEAVEAANRSKSEFLANMSHEIRTPMTAILGFADVLLEEDGLEKAPPERVGALETIKRNGVYLLELINDILDLSKIEAGKLEVERIVCAPSEVVDDVASLMRVRAEVKGLALKVEYIGGIPESIVCDPTRLRQVLINLVGNAIKFTNTGSVRLQTRLVQEAARPPRLQFDVIDTGIGLTQEQASRLFQPFTQADASTTRRFGGTGLGLTISQRLAELLGGNITISSYSGKGSTFSVTIETGPLDNVSILENITENVPQSKWNTKAAGALAVELDCRILLAEDGPDNQRLISFVLKKAGADVTVAENGLIAHDKALAALEVGEPFNVILMDMQMPVMDGYTATGKLREAGYTGPIIALTANAMADDETKCREAGCDDYATKPIDRAKLFDTIAQFLGRDVSATVTRAGEGTPLA